MLNASAQFKSEMNNDNRNFLPYADITLLNGTVLNLTPSEIWEGTFKVEDATSASGKFTIGAAIATKLSFTINNIYDDFSEYDFVGASIVGYIGLKLGDGTVEKIRFGTFDVYDIPQYSGSLITVTALDAISKFNKSYDKSTLKFPATLQDILVGACTDCGVTLLSNSFDNSALSVQSRPAANSSTYADIVSCVVQIAGCFARCDTYGRLYLSWYKYNLFNDNVLTSGGIFDDTTKASYQTGDTKDGGNFKDYSSGDTVSGGTFKDQNSYGLIYGVKSLIIATDDVVITGVSVEEDFTETETQKKSSFVSGTADYMIYISGNVLIQYGMAEEVCKSIYSKIVGMRFRPCSATAISNPLLESGDIAYLVDRKSNQYQVLITERSYTIGSSFSVSCDAESPLRNISESYSAAQKSYAKAKEQAKKDISTYDKAVQQLTNLMSQSFGVFKTVVVQEDGSSIYYMHNKPTLSASAARWKFTADALAVSTDYGKTWNAGIDSDGNAVVNVLNAIGINADWIRGGTLYLGGDNNVSGRCFVEDAAGTKLVTLDKNGLSLDSSVKIAWDNLSGVTDKVTEITKDTVTTDYVNALNIKAASVDAENITGTKISGKTIYGGSIEIGSNFSVDSSGTLKASSANISGTITADKVITSAGIGVEGAIKYIKEIKTTTNTNSYATDVSAQTESLRYVSSVSYNTGSQSFKDGNGSYHSFSYVTSINVNYSDSTFVKSVSANKSDISFAKDVQVVSSGYLNCNNGIIYSIS